MSLQDSSTPDWGDFVGSEDEYEVEESAEPVERYFEDSYYPIHIGQVIAQTYRIEHKLGHGGFSTVWMAHDIHKKKDVALKITIPGDVGEHELSMQNEIIRTVQDTSNLLTYEDTFTLHGHKGNHRVLVFPVQGPSLGSCLKPMSVAARMSAAKQLLNALKCLHNDGIVYRDLNNGSVMWGITPLDNYNTDTKYKYLGRPQKIALCLHPGRHAELVKPVKVPRSLIRETIYLGDFGLAIKAGTSVSQKIQSPAVYCAPERFHNINPSFASDMWSYMCLFVELYLGFTPFYGTGSASVVSYIVNVLGALPKQWKGRYNGAGTSDDSWYDQSRKPHPTMALKAMIERARPETSQTERNHVLSVMSKGFSHLPESRVSAAQLLQDASFKAVMKIYRC